MELFVPILVSALGGLTAVAYWHPTQYQKGIAPLIGTVALIMFGGGLGWSAALAQAGLALTKSAKLETTIAFDETLSALEIPSWIVVTFILVTLYLLLLAFLQPFGITAHTRNEPPGEIDGGKF
jgi:hypothetical protein